LTLSRNYNALKYIIQRELLNGFAFVLKTIHLKGINWSIWKTFNLFGFPFFTDWAYRM